MTYNAENYNRDEGHRSGVSVAVLVAVIACALLLCAGVGFASYYAGKHKAFNDAPRDTVTTVITVRDTVTVVKPQYITQRVIDKVLVPVTDTVQIHDTTFVEMEVEQKVYADSNYMAVVSGIRPSLDEISVYPETKIITQTITVTEPAKKKRFSLGVQGGWYVIYDAAHKQVATGPGGGAGLSFGWTF